MQSQELEEGPLLRRQIFSFIRQNGEKRGGGSISSVRYVSLSFNKERLDCHWTAFSQNLFFFVDFILEVCQQYIIYLKSDKNIR